MQPMDCFLQEFRGYLAMQPMDCFLQEYCILSMDCFTLLFSHIINQSHQSIMEPGHKAISSTTSRVHI